MQPIFSKCVAAALALGIVAAASTVADAHRAKAHRHSYWPATLPYSYAYDPVYGYSQYGNCYLVEQRAPDRTDLVRVCPPR